MCHNSLHFAALPSCVDSHLFFAPHIKTMRCSKASPPLPVANPKPQPPRRQRGMWGGASSSVDARCNTSVTSIEFKGHSEGNTCTGYFIASLIATKGSTPSMLMVLSPHPSSILPHVLVLV